MADAYWNRQPPMPKRPRADYDLQASMPPLGQEMLNYLPRDDDRGGPRVVKDTKTIGSAYDRYLQGVQPSSFGSGEASNFSGGAGLERGYGTGGGMSRLPIGEPGGMVCGPDLTANGRGVGLGSQYPMDRMDRLDRIDRMDQMDRVDTMARQGHEMPSPLPPDASNTLFVEGLPPDSTRREVAHIFRPFLGYKEVRLVNKEPKHHGGDPLRLCFVDFANPACAATCLNALQGYKMDDHDPYSPFLLMQFARYPGSRSGPGHHGGTR